MEQQLLKKIIKQFSKRMIMTDKVHSQLNETLSKQNSDFNATDKPQEAKKSHDLVRLGDSFSNTKMATNQERYRENALY